ncbi:MAG TPA: fibronectin type III domain-containing protein [Candidatus Limnocylindrales bacterium]|nr:fibronectin type III domain-containing protein [Candidatus Limnocylindrales bacterium]
MNHDPSYNDNRLDLLIAGTISGNTVSQLWRNTGFSSNSPPLAPASLTSCVSGDTVLLHWSPPAGDLTGEAGLSYNVPIGTAPEGVDIISPEADPATGWRRVAALGNLGKNLSAVVRLRPGNYYWSVQAVDSDYVGSPFALASE